MNIRIKIIQFLISINENIFFRWEFDNKQLSIEKIRNINVLFFNSADELISMDKKIINFR